MDGGNVKKYVLYHSKCTDGFGAAYVAWQKFKKEPDVTFIGVTYGHDIPEMVPDSEIYILDFAYPKEIIMKLAKEHKQVVVLDHHKTNLEEFTNTSPFPASAYHYKVDNVDVQFDMKRSGAMMAWDYFHPGEGAPRLIVHIQDNDLWKFQYKDTKPIVAALLSYPQDFEVWETFHGPTLETEGMLILRYQDEAVNSMVRQARFGNIAGHKVPITNASTLNSEVGNKLLEIYPDAPFAATYSDLANGKRMWSLRSRDHGAECDVSLIAQKYGGGGHPGAAGFKQTVGHADLP